MKKGNSGQTFIVTALLIILIIFASVSYICESMQTISEVDSQASMDYILSVKLASRHTMIGALANISQGGQPQILETALYNCCALVKNYLYGRPNLSFTLLNTSPYSSGIWLYWGSDGFGISSAYANFTLNLIGLANMRYGYLGEANNTIVYVWNITTSISIFAINQSQLIEIRFTLHNDLGYGLVKNFDPYYYQISSSSWVIPNNYTAISYGNGTYLVSIANLDEPVADVSLQVYDQRGIFVMANATVVSL